MVERIYCTGASGFIGRALSAQLEVSPIPHEQIRLTTIEPFDRFFFLSSYGNLYDQTDDEKIIQANLLDLVHLLKQVPPIDFKSFVYVSSSSVKLRTQTMYSRMKRAAEEVMLAYAEKHDLPLCVVRPFSVTGVGEQPSHLIPTLIRSCLTGEHMNFVPQPVHDFIDVADVVAGMINLSEHSARGIFELGTATKYSNQQVLEMVERLTGREANVTTVESLRPYDSGEWVSNNFGARKYGWLPKKSLEQSITEMIKEFKRAH